MLTAPEVHPMFWRFAAGLGVFIGVAAVAVVAGLSAVWKIFGPKKEEEMKVICERAINCKYVPNCSGKKPHDKDHVCDGHYCPEIEQVVKCVPVASRHCIKCDRTAEACRCAEPELVEREKKP